MPIHQSIYAWKNISPYFFCRSISSLHTCDKRFFNTPSLLQRNSEALLPPKFLTFYKLFTNEEETPLTFTADSEALWANIFSLFLLLFQPKKKSPSLSMGLQKHFEHPKFAPFTFCLHSKPLSKAKWHFSNSHFIFWATKNPIRLLTIPNRIFIIQLIQITIFLAISSNFRSIFLISKINSTRSSFSLIWFKRSFSKRSCSS